MGFTWSLFFAQDANTTILQRQPGFFRSHLLTDRGSPWVISRARLPEDVGGTNLDQNACHYVYVDNLGIAGTNFKHVTSTLQTAQEAFNSIGLTIHDVHHFERGGPALGVVLDGERLETVNKCERFGRLYGGITALLRRKRISVWVLETVLGHATFFSLVRREALSIFHCCYRFVQAHYVHRTRLWESAREELEAFRDVMVLVRARWDLKWCHDVYVSDASLAGWSISRSTWPREEVAEIGRVNER